MLKQLKLGSTIAVLLLFFLPWIDIRCDNDSLMTQSGVQSMYGGYTASDELKQSQKHHQSHNDKADPAYFVIITCAATLLSIFIFSIHLFNEGLVKCGKLGGILTLVALMMLITQMSVGFPLANKMKKKYSRGGTVSIENNVKHMISKTDDAVQVKTKISLYFVMILLAVPSGLMFKDT